MNKISKKIVSLVTMAAFALTLVPAAAFAAEGNAHAGLTPSTSTIFLDATDEAKVSLTVTPDSDWADSEFTQLGIAAVNSNSTDVANDTLGESTVVFSGFGTTSSGWGNAYWTTSGITAGTAISGTATFKAAGVYDLYLFGYNKNNSSLADTTYEHVGTVTVVDPVISAQTSYFGTVDANASANVGEKVPVEFDLRDSAYRDLNDVTGAYTTGEIAIWATDGNTVTDALTVDGTTAAQVGKTYAYSLDDVDDITVSFTRAANSGTYTLHAALVNGATTIADLEKNEISSDSTHNTVEVTAQESDVASINLYNVTDQEAMTPGSNGEYSDTLTPANGAESNTYRITALDGDGDAVANKEFTVTSSSSALRVTALSMDGVASEDGTITTNRNGQFQINYNATQSGTYKIYIESGDFRAVVNVTAGDVNRYADTIAANETDVTVDADQASNSNLVNAVTYTLTDNDGNIISNNAIAGNNILNQAEGCLTGNTDYVKLLAKPDNFRGDASDFKLVYDTDANAYTLKCDATLVPGEYTVRIILHSGNYADATFTVGNFNANRVNSLTINTTSDTVEYDGTINYRVLAVDTNGVSRDVTNDTGRYTLGIDAAAPLEGTVSPAGTIKLSGVTVENKDTVIGTRVNLIAASDVYGKLAQTSVTVVDKGVVAGLEFDKTEGQVNTNNVVKATVVDENGNTMTNVLGRVFAYVVDQSNANARVDVTAGGNASRGVGSLTIFSDQATTVDIVVGIQANTSDGNSAIYADTLTYTIGEADENADKLVAMTIGSSNYIVDNDVVEGDAAPYVDSAWRTMVPIRALAETFGATVDFTDNVVTIVDGDTTVVMTIGETTYTVNDDEATMDTAPVIGDGDRTYVPVRFVAEALGYTVTPLQDANGLTASVVFQK